MRKKREIPLKNWIEIDKEIREFLKTPETLIERCMSAYGWSKRQAEVNTKYYVNPEAVRKEIRERETINLNIKKKGKRK